MINVPLYGDARRAVQEGIAKQKKTSINSMLGGLTPKSKPKTASIASSQSFTPSIFGTPVPASGPMRPVQSKYGPIASSYGDVFESGMNADPLQNVGDWDLEGLLNQLMPDAQPNLVDGIKTPGWWKGARPAGALRKYAKSFGPQSLAQYNALANPSSLEYWMANWDESNPNASDQTRSEFKSRLDAIRKQMLWATGPKNKSVIDPQFAVPRGPRTLNYPTDISLGEDAYGPIGPGRIDPELMDEVIKSLWKFDPRTGQTGDFLTDWSIQNQALVAQIQNQEKKSRPPTAVEGVLDNLVNRYREADGLSPFSTNPEDQMKQLMAILAPLEAVAGGTIAPLEEATGSMIGRPIARGQQEFRDPGMGAAEGTIDPNEFVRQGDWVDWAYKNLLNLVPITRLANIGTMAGQGLEGAGAYAQEAMGRGNKRSEEVLKGFTAPYEADPVGEISSLLTGLLGPKALNKFKSRGKSPTRGYVPPGTEPTLMSPPDITNVDPTLIGNKALDPNRTFEGDGPTLRPGGKTLTGGPTTTSAKGAKGPTKLAPGMEKNGWVIEEVLDDGNVTIKNPAGGKMELPAEWVAEQFGVKTPYAEKTYMGSREKTQSFDAEKELGVKPKDVAPKTEAPEVEAPGTETKWDAATKASIKNDIKLMNEMGIDENAQRAFIREKYGWNKGAEKFGWTPEEPKTGKTKSTPKPKATPVVSAPKTPKPATPKPAMPKQVAKQPSEPLTDEKKAQIKEEIRAMRAFGFPEDEIRSQIESKYGITSPQPKAQKPVATPKPAKPASKPPTPVVAKPTTPAPKPPTPSKAWPVVEQKPTAQSAKVVKDAAQNVDLKNLSREQLAAMGFNPTQAKAYLREPIAMRERWVKMHSKGKADVKTLAALAGLGITAGLAAPVISRILQNPEDREKLKKGAAVFLPIAAAAATLGGNEGRKNVERIFDENNDYKGPTAQDEAEYYAMLARDAVDIQGQIDAHYGKSGVNVAKVGEAFSKRQGVTEVVVLPEVTSNTRSGKKLSRFFSMRLENPSTKQMQDIPMVIIPSTGRDGVSSLTHSYRTGDGYQAEAANIVAFRGNINGVDWRFTERDYETLLQKPKDASWADYPELLDGVFRGFTRPIEIPFNQAELDALQRTTKPTTRTKKGTVESKSEVPAPRSEALTQEKADVENAFIQYALLSTGNIVDYLNLKDPGPKAKEVVQDAFNAFLQNKTRTRRNMTDDSLFMEKQSGKSLGRNKALFSAWERITGQDKEKMSELESDPVKGAAFSETTVEGLQKDRDVAGLKESAILGPEGEFIATSPDAHQRYVKGIREAADALPEDLRKDFDEIFYSRNKEGERGDPKKTISVRQADYAHNKVLELLDQASPETAREMYRRMYETREKARLWAKKTLKNLMRVKTQIKNPDGTVSEIPFLSLDWIQHDYNVNVIQDALFSPTGVDSPDDFFWAADIVDRMRGDLRALHVISQHGFGPKGLEAAQNYVDPETGDVVDVSAQYKKAESRFDKKRGTWLTVRQAKEMNADTGMDAMMYESTEKVESRLNDPKTANKQAVNQTPEYQRQIKTLLDSLKERNKGVLPEKIAGVSRDEIIAKIKDPDWKVKRSVIPHLQYADSYMRLRTAVEDKHGGKIPDRVAGVPSAYLEMFLDSPKPRNKQFALTLMELELRDQKPPRTELENYFKKDEKGKFYGIKSSGLALGLGALALADAGSIVASVGEYLEENEYAQAGLTALAGAAALWSLHNGGRVAWRQMKKFGKGQAFADALDRAWLKAELTAAKFRNMTFIQRPFVSVDTAIKDTIFLATHDRTLGREVLGAVESVIGNATKKYNNAAVKLNESLLGLSAQAKKLLEPMPDGQFVGSRHRYVSAMHKGDPIPPELKPVHDAWMKEQRDLEKFAWESKTMSTVRETVAELDTKRMVGKEVQFFDQNTGEVVQGEITGFGSPGKAHGIHAFVKLENGKEILLSSGVEVARRSYLDETFMPLRIREDLERVFENRDFHHESFQHLKKWAQANGFLPSNPSNEQVLMYWKEALGITRKVMNADNSKMRSPLNSRLTKLRSLSSHRLPAWAFDTDALSLMQEHLKRGYMMVEEAKMFGAKDARILANFVRRHGMSDVEIEQLYNLMTIKLGAHKAKWTPRDWRAKHSADKISSAIYAAKLMNDSIGLLQLSQSASGYAFMGAENMAKGALQWLGAQNRNRSGAELVKAFKTGRVGNVAKAMKRVIQGWDFFDTPMLQGAMDVQTLVDAIGGEMGSRYKKGLTPHKLMSFQAKATGTGLVDTSQRIYMAHASHAMVKKSLEKLRNSLDKKNPNWRSLNANQIVKLVDGLSYDDRWVREFVRPTNSDYANALKGNISEAFTTKSYKAGVRANVLMEQGVLPEWASTPTGRIAYQFQSFMFGQSQLAKFAFKEAVLHGNSVPLARMLLGSVAVYQGQALAYEQLQEVLDLARQFMGKRKPFSKTVKDGDLEYQEPQTFLDKKFEDHLNGKQKDLYRRVLDAWLGTAMMGVVGTPVEQYVRNLDRGGWKGNTDDYDRVIPPAIKTGVDLAAGALDMTVLPSKKTLIEKARHHAGELVPQLRREMDRAGVKRTYK